MTSKEVEIKGYRQMLDEMIDLQRTYDTRCFQVNHIRNGYKGCDLNMALADEAGELIHELKPDWCWWGRGKGKVDREKVLEEWVDCVHFILAKNLASRSREQENFQRAFKTRLEDTYLPIMERKIPLDVCDPIPAALGALLSSETDTAYTRTLALISITLRLGFTWPQVYEAYKAKNRVNHRRLEALEIGDAQKALTEEVQA